MKRLQEQLKVYFIMGSTNCRKDPVEVLADAIAGGITLFQFREKGEGALSGDGKYQLAKQLQRLCQKNGVPFIVNDDIDLALALDADGVHIGQEDEPVKWVREKIGSRKILGVSVHSEKEARLALQGGADYFGIGPVYPTKTKADAKPSRGTELIKLLRAGDIMTPIVGIGGITSENAAAVVEAGADGVSVISAISIAESPLEAAQAIRKNIER